MTAAVPGNELVTSPRRPPTRYLEPTGAFVPRSLDRDLLLYAAGSGITPIMSIVKSALAVGSGSTTMLYANRDADSIIFKAELEELEKSHPERLEVFH